jgi:hypothetical protein
VRLFIPGALRISYGHRRLALVQRRHARDGRERMTLLRKDTPKRLDSICDFKSSQCGGREAPSPQFKILIAISTAAFRNCSASAS